jgi:restriction system protein
MANNTTWMVRGGQGGSYVKDFLSRKIVGISWKEMDRDLSNVKDLSEIKEFLKKAYPDSKAGYINQAAGQIYRFRFEFSIGDQVITYDPQTRTYGLGVIDSDYHYNPSLKEYPHFRNVTWQKNILRDDLSTAAKNSLGSIMTVFSIDENTADELSERTERLLPETIVVDEKETLDTIKEEIEEKAHEFIKDKIQELNWEQLQELVAGILRGMGYKTLVSQRGPDRGKDIIASPDGLGLEDPKIKVEVKHREQSMGAPEIRSFIGGLRPGEKGLYVSTGGFTKEANYEAERANVPVTLIDSDLLVTLVIQNYDQFDADARALLPLRKIYWPI